MITSDFFEVIKTESGGIVVMQRGDPSMRPQFLGAYTNARDFIEALAKDLNVDVAFPVRVENEHQFDLTQLRKDLEAVTERQIA